MEPHRALRRGPHRPDGTGSPVPRGRVHRHRHLGRRLRPARRRRPAARRTHLLPRQPHRRTPSSGSTTGSARTSCTPINGLQFLPFNTIYQLEAETVVQACGSRQPTSSCSPTCSPTGSPGELPHRGHQRLHHRPARRPHRGLVAEVLRLPRRALGPPARDRAARRGPRHAAARGPRRHRPARRHRGHHGRVARHRLRRRRRACGRTPVRLRLQRHLVARRARARQAGPDGGEPAGELHQRRRRRRPDPLPAQRRRAVAPPGVHADVARRGRSTSTCPRCSPKPRPCPRGGPTIDVDDPDFIAPGRMPERIAEALHARGPPPTEPRRTRCAASSTRSPRHTPAR